MRTLLHTRTVVCEGYALDSGLWEIQGRINDVKTQDLLEGDGSIRLPAGQPLHTMTLTLTVDDTLMIVRAHAETHHAPNEECRSIGPRYDGLVGLRIGPGFIGEVKSRFKGALGCTHLTELVGPIATTAFQTLWPLIDSRRREKEARERADGRTPRPAMLDSCYALRSSGELARVRWPSFHTLSTIG